MSLLQGQVCFFFPRIILFLVMCMTHNGCELDPNQNHSDWEKMTKEGLVETQALSLIPDASNSTNPKQIFNDYKKALKQYDIAIERLEKKFEELGGSALIRGKRDAFRRLSISGTFLILFDLVEKMKTETTQWSIPAQKVPYAPKKKNILDCLCLNKKCSNCKTKQHEEEAKSLFWGNRFQVVALGRPIELFFCRFNPRKCILFISLHNFVPKLKLGATENPAPKNPTTASPNTIQNYNFLFCRIGRFNCHRKKPVQFNLNLEPIETEKRTPQPQEKHPKDSGNSKRGTDVNTKPEQKQGLLLEY